MLLFVTSILSFVWRTGSTADPQSRSPLPPTVALAPRIAVSGVFAIGMVYFTMIVITLTRYGSTFGERVRRESRFGNTAVLGSGPGGGAGGRELEAAMESRGRRREVDRARSGVRASRREAVERREAGGDGGSREKGGTGLRPVMGLGLTGMGEGGGDLEKGVVPGEGTRER
jgi:hypothetical protein